MLQALFVAAHGFFEAEVEGVADEGMAYGHFVEIGHAGCKECKVFEVEVVAGVHSHPGAVGGAGGFDIGS